MPEIRGRLERWQVVYKDAGFQIFGQLFDDSLGTFPDDTYFHTTMIQTPIEDIISGNVVQSIDHQYLLGEQSSEEGAFFLVDGVCVRSDEM